MFTKYFQEELIKEFHKEYKKILYKVSIFKNPKSIKRMMEGLRGIILPNGDLYVVDYEPIEKSFDFYDRYSILHTDILFLLKNEGIIKGNVENFKYENINKYITKYLLVVTYDKETIQLGESYYKRGEFWEEYEYVLRDYEERVQKKNPNIKFDLLK